MLTLIYHNSVIQSKIYHNSDIHSKYYHNFVIKTVTKLFFNWKFSLVTFALLDCDWLSQKRIKTANVDLNGGWGAQICTPAFDEWINIVYNIWARWNTSSIYCGLFVLSDPCILHPLLMNNVSGCWRISFFAKSFTIVRVFTCLLYKHCWLYSLPTLTLQSLSFDSLFLY